MFFGHNSYYINQLEKLQAARSAYTFAYLFWASEGLSWPFWALLGLTRPYSALLGLTRPYSALLGLMGLIGPYFAFLLTH